MLTIQGLAATRDGASTGATDLPSGRGRSTDRCRTVLALRVPDHDPHDDGHRDDPDGRRLEDEGRRHAAGLGGPPRRSRSGDPTAQPHGRQRRDAARRQDPAQPQAGEEAAEVGGVVDAPAAPDANPKPMLMTIRSRAG